MNWEKITLAVIQHALSWPALVLVVVLVFRKPLAALLGRVSSYEGMGQKVTFGEELAEVEAEVDALVQEAVARDELDAPDREQEIGQDRSAAEGLRAFGASGAVIHAWGTIERAMSKLVVGDYVSSRLLDQFRQPSMVLGWGPARLAGPLIQVGILPVTLGPVLDDLGKLRNKVAHGLHNPTDGEAITFSRTAAEVVAVLNSLRASIESRFPNDEDD